MGPKRSCPKCGEERMKVMNSDILEHPCYVRDCFILFSRKCVVICVKFNGLGWRRNDRKIQGFLVFSVFRVLIFLEDFTKTHEVVN